MIEIAYGCIMDLTLALNRKLHFNLSCYNDLQEINYAWEN